MKIKPKFYICVYCLEAIRSHGGNVKVASITEDMDTCRCFFCDEDVDVFECREVVKYE